MGGVTKQIFKGGRVKEIAAREGKSMTQIIIAAIRKQYETA